MMLSVRRPGRKYYPLCIDDSPEPAEYSAGQHASCETSHNLICVHISETDARKRTRKGYSMYDDEPKAEDRSRPLK
jgi:hypothetical protein